MDDKTISLKEALAEIDAMPSVNAEGHDFIEKTCLKTRLELLPSAPPEEDCDTCVHGHSVALQCSNCRLAYQSNYERDDMISRQAAMDANTRAVER